MKRNCAISVCICAVVLSLAAYAEEPLSKPNQVFMRQKLTYAQGVLEGIALEKFDLVITNAAKLRDMSQTNAFVLLGNLDYQTYKTNFQTSIDSLTAAAKEQNHEKAVEAYTRMTQSCFECHRTFRREQFIKSHLTANRLENPNPPERNQP